MSTRTAHAFENDAAHRVAVEAGLAQGIALGLLTPDLFASRSERRARSLPYG